MPVQFFINPFSVNEGGFGPEIKGLRLGMKVPVSSLKDTVMFELQRTGFKDSKMLLTIHYEDEGDRGGVYVHVFGGQRVPNQRGLS